MTDHLITGCQSTHGLQQLQLGFEKHRCSAAMQRREFTFAFESILHCHLWEW